MTNNIDEETHIKNICKICYSKDVCGVRKKKWDGCDFLPKIKISVNPTGDVYTMEKVGTLPSILMDLITKRVDIQAKMQQAELDGNEYLCRVYFDMQRTFKFFMNAFFGIFGSRTHRPFRLRSKRLAANITRGAREHLKWNKNFIENYKLLYKQHHLRFDVIYMDTDSCLTIIIDYDKYNFDLEDLKTIANILLKDLNASFDEFAKEVFWVDKHYFKIKLEGCFLKYFQWGKKKHYVYLDENGILKFKGVKIRRSDASKLQKSVLKAFFILLMEQEVSIKEIGKFFRKVEHNIRSGILDNGVIKPVGVHIDTNNYVPAIKYSNKYLGYNFVIDNCKPFFVPVKRMKPGYPKPPKIAGVRQIAIGWRDDPKKFVQSFDYDWVIKNGMDTKSFNNVLRGLPELRGKHPYDKLKTMAVKVSIDQFF